MKKSVFSRAASLVVAAAMIVTSCLGLTGKSDSPGALAAGEVNYTLHDYTPEQLMGNFGVMALNQLDINTHCHSNFLVGCLKATSDSGLRTQYDPYTKSEEFYFETFESVSAQMSSSPQSGYLYIGKDVKVTTAGDSVTVEYNGKSGIINKPGSNRVTHETDTFRYADLDDIAQKMKAYNEGISQLANEGTVTYILDGTGDHMNSRNITCTGEGMHVLNLSGQTSKDFFAVGTKIDINFEGITDEDTETSLVINIDMKGVPKDPQIKDLVLQYNGRGLNNSEANATTNHNRIYYNFYDSSKADKQYMGTLKFDGRGFGTIIAPSATVDLGQNWDGMVVGNKVEVNGEFHRIVNPIGAPKVTGVADEKTGEIKLAKKNVHNDMLEGAKLELEINSQKHDLENVKVKVGGTDTLIKNTGAYSLAANEDGIANKKIQWTSTTNKVELTELPEGEYIWKETEAPDGYEPAPEIRFKVGADGKVYLYTGNDDYSNKPYEDTLVMIDGVVTQAAFSKQDKDNSIGNTELARAELKLMIISPDSTDLSEVTSVSGPKPTLSVDKKSITWISGTTPAVFEHLPDGEYTWEELEAPVGYKPAEPVKFKIENAKIYMYTSGGYSPIDLKENKLIMFDEVVTATGSLSKQTVAGKELAGAKMALEMKSREHDLNLAKVISGPVVKSMRYDFETKEWTSVNVTGPVFRWEWMSTGTPLKIQGLPVGEYEWIEIDHPDGYETADPIKFKVDVDGKIYQYNDKTGAYSKTATEKLIMVDHLIGDPDTPNPNPNTPNPNPNTPNPNPGGNDPVTPVTPDTPAGTGNLKVIVYDEKTNEVVPNATVVITYPDGVTQKTDVTNSNGELSVSKVPAGEYTVVTAKVPDGYTVTAGKKHTAEVKVDETTVLEVFINTDVGTLIITVYDEKTNEVVPNATVTVTYPDGTKSPYITDSEGKITLSNVPVGKYVTETTKVPDGYTVTVGKTYEATVVASQITECKIYIVTDKTDKSVNTGDTFKVLPLIVIMTVALFGIVIMIVKRRKCEK